MNNYKQKDEIVGGKNYEKEINIRDVYIVVKRRFWILILFIITFTILGSLYVSTPRTPLYESSTRIYLQASSDLSNTVKVILREPIVLDGVINNLNLNKSAEGLRGQISISSIEGSTVMRLTVVDTNPFLAADIANAIVDSYSKVARDTVFYTSIIVLTEAEVGNNPQPINPKSNRALYMSFIAGALLGIGVIFLLDSLDDRIRTERQIEELLDTAVLGHVSKIKKRDVLKKPIKKKGISLRSDTIGS